MNKALLFLFGLLGGVALTIVILFALDVVKMNLDDDPLVVKTLIDTVYVEQKPEIQIERVIEKVDVMNTDTVMLLTNINQNIDSGDYVVLRDQLLHSQRVKIIRKDPSNTQTASDKLVNKMSSDHIFADHLNVEFWESPIEYQGYRLNKTKLILFGINPNESFMLTENQDGFLIMQTGEFKTILQPTEKYRSFNFQ